MKIKKLDMRNTNTRSFILLFVALVTIVFFFNRYGRSNLSAVPCVCGHIGIYSSSKSSIYSSRIEVNNSGQIFAFPDESPSIRLYLDVVRDTVCGLTLRTQEQSVEPSIEARKYRFNLRRRIVGQDWPSIGITMIGQKRLNNLEWAIRFVIANNIPGDFIECGVWRGGGSIFARAVLKALSITDRHVWVADSFQGLPMVRATNSSYWEKHNYLKVSLDEVQTNFRSFDLLDGQVHFCKGYFVDSLPRCAVSRIAVLRMDGDMYESTMDQLFNLYEKIAVGGVIIVDDYNIPECVKAISDFRAWHDIKEEINSVLDDRSGAFWIKQRIVKVEMHRYKSLLGSTKT